MTMAFLDNVVFDFNPLPPHGGRPATPDSFSDASIFQSTPSAWRETPKGGSKRKPYRKFQSTPSAWRETKGSGFRITLICNFNPLPPHGGRRTKNDGFMLIKAFQSTPSAWRETPIRSTTIYSPGISIHSLRMEGDERSTNSTKRHRAFQSTPSAWRETPYHMEDKRKESISIHSLRMEGDMPYIQTSLLVYISIHSLRMEGDIAAKPFTTVLYPFQSTPSAWRETSIALQSLLFSQISIHSLRMEGDNQVFIKYHLRLLFQSTPSAWRETISISSFCTVCLISIHSLRMEGDRMDIVTNQIIIGISIHSLRMEGDLVHLPGSVLTSISIHSLRMEGDESTSPAWRRMRNFNPLPPHGGRQ